MDTSGLKKKKEKQPISKENIKTTFKRPEVLKIIKKKKSGSKIQRNKQWLKTFAHKYVKLIFRPRANIYAT